MKAATPTISKSSTLTLTEAIENGLRWLETIQNPDGFWVGVLESNTCIDAEWLLAMHFLGISDHPLREGIAQGICNCQGVGCVGYTINFTFGIKPEITDGGWCLLLFDGCDRCNCFKCTSRPQCVTKHGFAR